jgi:hypothetical protein
MWINIGRFPTKEREPYMLFGARPTASLASEAGTKWIFQLALRPDGKLQVRSSSQKDAGIFGKASLSKGRWVHLALVHHQNRAVNPSIRKYLYPRLILD